MKLISWFKENYWLAIILTAAAALRLYHADFQSLWVDEVLTMENANPALTLKQFYDRIMFWEFIPHLYFLLVRFLFEIFGPSTALAREFSGIIGVAGVYAIYLLARRLFNKDAGLIAAALLCVNYFHIAYSQEIRPYGMLFLFTVLAFYRLVIFIQKPTIRNAIYHGIFAALIIHSHFFGFITLFSQYLILLFFFVKSAPENRKTFFINSFVSGIVTVIMLLPAYEAILRVSAIKSFWLLPPGPDAFTKIFTDFFGGSEIVLFLIHFIAIFYAVNLFRAKTNNYRYEAIVGNKTIFSFIIMFIWLFISLIIPLLKSYLDVPMILGRYLINTLAVLILVIACGLGFIRNAIVRYTAVAALLLFSLIDVIVVKNYYNTPTKSQIRELTQEIKKRNPEKSKVVTFWAWIFPYYFQDDPQIQVQEKTLDDYVDGMRRSAIDQKPFWFAETNSKVFTISPENQAYMDQNFILKEKLQYLDAWAHYYVPKNAPVAKANDNLDLTAFKPVSFDGNGSMLLFENTNARSGMMSLAKGNYNLVVKGNSLPAKPINGENAHIRIKLNGIEIANFNLSEDANAPERSFPFSYAQDEKVRFQLIYDNDIALNGLDRNAIIHSIRLEKK